MSQTANRIIEGGWIGGGYGCVWQRATSDGSRGTREVRLRRRSSIAVWKKEETRNMFFFLSRGGYWAIIF